MNQQQARRSERLRRKRQSTPGLSQPGNYSLYNKGYVVESEASFLPEAPKRTPRSSRRIRYKDSPHVYDTSPPVADADENPAQNVIDRVRVSLFDILGSAARQPVNSTWRAAARSRVTEREDEEVDEVQQDEMYSTVRNLENEFEERGPRSMKPVILLVALFIGSLGLIFVLDGIVKSRTDGGPGAWSAVKSRCTTTGLYVMESGSALMRFLLRPSWRETRVQSGGMTRAEFEEEILPEILREARNAAAKEAARISRRAGKEWSGGQFGSFVERFAGDKDLPADFALASAGGTITYSQPSGWEQYLKFGKRYVDAMLGSGPITPEWPRLAGRMLDADVLPGNCWAFQGNAGEVGIKFGRAMRAESVTMEHTPKASVVSTDSAPRRFEVKGMIFGGGEVDLGEFEFDIDGGHLQRFEVKKSDKTLRGVMLRIKSNWGASHTTVYRFRVHGTQISLDELTAQRK